MKRPPRPYLNPTSAGIALGVVLLTSFVVAGRGIGASGAFAAAAGRTLDIVAPTVAAGDPVLADRIPTGVALLDDWIVLQLAGLCGWCSWLVLPAPKDVADWPGLVECGVCPQATVPAPGDGSCRAPAPRRASTRGICELRHTVSWSEIEPFA